MKAIGGQGVGFLARVLPKCEKPFLICSATASGMRVQRVAGKLGQCTALEELDLTENDMGPAGFAGLKDALDKCSPEAQLFLDDDPDSEANVI
eukprot:581194-Rhodomonas_salina.1